MTKLDKNFYDKQGCATRLTATLKASITCAMLTIFIGTANADLLNTDVKFNDAASDGVFGPYKETIPNQSQATIQNYVNGISTTKGNKTYAGNLLAGGNWTFLVRDNKSTTNSVSAIYEGFTFTLSAANGQNGQSTPSAWGLGADGHG